MEEGSVAFAVMIEQAAEAEFRKYPEYMNEIKRYEMNPWDYL